MKQMSCGTAVSSEKCCTLSAVMSFCGRATEPDVTDLNAALPDGLLGGLAEAGREVYRDSS